MQINNSSPTLNMQSPPSPPCAACKHQRKKCGPDCKLARYFPADRIREFQVVHKVFGVSNVTKIVHGVEDEESRQKVAESLIWEARWREKDPVSGPYGEYQRILEELKGYRSQIRNQLMQLQEQRGMIYKTASQPLMGWNNPDEMNIRVSGNEQYYIPGPFN